MKVLRWCKRDFILHEMPDGKIQPFYRSTGKNSGMPGQWLPFDGIRIYPSWVDKSKYLCRYNKDIPTYLERFGTKEIKEQSEHLATLDIPEGEESSAEEINEMCQYDWLKAWKEKEEKGWI